MSDFEEKQPLNKYIVNEKDTFIENTKTTPDQEFKHAGDNSDDERHYNLGYVLQMTFIAAIGGFLFGYDTGVIAGAQLYFSETWPDITELQKGTIVSIAQLGAAIGCIFSGPVSDKYGRKPTIIMADAFFTIGAIIMGVSPSIPILILGRFIVGIGVGIGSMIAPCYIGESSPIEIRGKLITCNVLFITGAQFISYLVCIGLGNHWRLMLGLAAVPSLLQLIGMIFMPETPVFLQKQGKTDQSYQVLKKIYKPKYIQQKRLEMNEEIDAIRLQSKDPFLTNAKNLFTTYGKCILIGGGLQFWQQFSGINTVMYFGPNLLEKAGFGSDDPNAKNAILIESLPLAATNALGSIIAIFYIDRLGRRMILLRLIPFISVALIILAIGLGLNGYGSPQVQSDSKWISLTGILLYLIFFSISLGSVPWSVNAEIYPLHLRGVGQSIATTVNWVSNYCVSQAFLLTTTDALGQIITFSALSLCCWGSWIFVYKLLPETKGRPIEEIVEEICPHTKHNKILLEHNTTSEQLMDQSIGEK